MKKHYKLALILGVLAFAIVACNRDDEGTNAPDLIEPADGATISEAPTFVWSSVPLIEDYRIVIDSGSSSIYTLPFRLGKTAFTDPIIEKDLSDTTYTMSGADFDNLEDGTYYWKAASLKYPPDGSAPDVNWSEVRSFKIEKADTSVVTAPELIEPEDGAVFSSEPPTFIWNSQPLADGYTIVINDDSSMTGDTVLSEDLYDTAYTMSASEFEGLENGTYYWTAAAYDDPADGSTRLYYWAEVRSFIVEEPAPFDLDTTYFPFGMNYEWVYEVHRWGHKSWNFDGSDPYEEWDYYDTVTIRITDSVVTTEGWTFTVEGGRFLDVNYYDDKARIRGEKIEIFGWLEIELEPEPTGTSMPGEGLGIVYEQDTLYMGFLFDMYSDEHHNEEWDDFTRRMKGKGVMKQKARYHDWDMRIGMEKSDLSMSEYELLSFSKGNETVWRR